MYSILDEFTLIGVDPIRSIFRTLICNGGGSWGAHSQFRILIWPLSPAYGALSFPRQVAMHLEWYSGF